jgi:dethiobiotin synthetase
MNKDVFVTGTDTGIGKTVLSALLVAALNRPYWKPIQTGSSEGTDREAVIKWGGIPACDTYPEAFRFVPPVSPHLAAEQQGVRIDVHALRRPADLRPIVIEGAGGVLVPINEEALMIDLIRHLHVPAVVVARTTLGTINHTLLTVAAIRAADLKLIGVVLVGKEDSDNRKAIERYGRVPVVGTIPWLKSIDRSVLIQTFEQRFDKNAFA